MKRLSLQSLLFLVACVAISVAWFVQSRKPPDIYYLHAFSAYFNLDHTATTGVSPGIPFHGRFSADGGQEVYIHGIVKREGDQFACTLNMFVEHPGAPDNFSTSKIIPLDTLVEFSDYYSVVISRTSDPAEIQTVFGDRIDYLQRRITK